MTRWQRHADSYAQESGRLSRERAHLLAWLAALHPASAVITPAVRAGHHGSVRLRLMAGGRQLSWSVRPDDLALFEHVPFAEPAMEHPLGHAESHTDEHTDEHAEGTGADQDAHIRRHTHLLAIEGSLLGVPTGRRPPRPRVGP
ncbi:hypothetical protein ABZZ79_26255 [Streptomyces sp. NPDC006458]|uniref:hypothetical protein n=1 Tax=Streptomyces sp. NPDC006458 TaxID=3154302 RepID=UPI0033B03659